MQTGQVAQAEAEYRRIEVRIVLARKVSAQDCVGNEIEESDG